MKQAQTMKIPMRRSRLARISNWSGLAHESGYSVAALAAACRVSTRTLENFFLSSLGGPPRSLLRKFRMMRAVELLRDGTAVKETAFLLGYSEHSHFSRDYKDYYGCSPANHHAQQGK